MTWDRHNYHTQIIFIIQFINFHWDLQCLIDIIFQLSKRMFILTSSNNIVRKFILHSHHKMTSTGIG